MSTHTCTGSGCPLSKGCNLFQEFKKDNASTNKKPVLPTVPYQDGDCEEFVPSK